MAGEAQFRGTLVPGADSIRNAHIKSNAGIEVGKMQHAYVAGTNFDLPIGSTPVAREEIVYVANGAGEVRGFHALLNDTGTTTSVTFDLKKNGVSILSSVVTVAHTDADREVKDGTVSNVTLAAGDVLSIALAVSSSTGAQGAYAWVSVEENSAPN